MPVILYGVSLLLKTFSSPFFSTIRLIDRHRKNEKRERARKRDRKGKIEERAT